MPPSGRPRARRGATLVLVTMLIVGLVGMAALAIDIGRMRLAAAELQTAADAAALGGARAVQLDPSNASSGAPSAASTVGAKNRAYGAAAGIAGADVKPMRYDSDDRTISAATWSTANAVEVTARAQGTYLLGKVLGASAPPSVGRRGSAWIANVNGAACLKPFIVPYSGMYRQAFGGSGASPDFTQAQIATLRSLPSSFRTFVLIRPYAQSNQPYNEVWSDADYTGQRSTARLGDWTAGRNCSLAQASIREVIPTGVDTGQAMVNAVSNNLGSVCNFRSATDARCYASATATLPGVEIRVPFADVNRQNGNTHPPATVRMIAVLRLMCYHRTTSDVCSAAPTYPGGGWSSPYATTGYPPGTLVFLAEAPNDIDLTPDVELGDVVSLTQRLILAR